MGNYTRQITSISRAAGQEILPPKEGLLGTITKPLAVLDVPLNTVKGGLGFIKTGDAEYLEAALKSLSPFHHGRRIPFSEVSGFKPENKVAKFATELGGDILIDPLTYVFGLGILSKLGKAKKAHRTLTAALRVAEEVEDLDKVKDLTLRLKDLSKIIETTTGAERNIVSLGVPFVGKKLNIGNFDHVVSLLDKSPRRLFPDFRRLEYIKELENVQRSRLRVLNKGKDVTKYDKRITELTDKISGYKPSIVPERYAELLHTIKVRFQHEPDHPVLKALDDYVRQSEAVDKTEFAKVRDKMLQDFEVLRDAEHIEAAELLKQLIRGAEARFVRTADPVELVNQIDLDHIKLRRLSAKKASDEIRKTLKKKKDPIDQFPLVDRSLEAHAERLEKIAFKQESKRLKLREAEKVWGELSPAEIAFIENYSGTLEELAKIEKSLGINIDIIEPNRQLLSYVRRVLTPEARKFKAKNPSKYTAIMHDMRVRLDAARKRTIFPEQEIAKVNELLREQGLNFDFFSTDLLNSIHKRNIEHINAVHRAKAVNVAVKLLGTTDDVPGITAKAFFEKLGLDGRVAPKGVKIPKEIANDAFRIDKLLQNSLVRQEPVAHFLQVAEKINQPFRVLLTTPFAAFHNRNMISNWWLNSLGGVRNPFKYIEAAKLQHKMRLTKAGKYTPTKEELKTFDELIKYRAVTDFGFWDELKATGVEDWLKKKTGLDVERPITGTIENWAEKLGKTPRPVRSEYNALANPMVGRAWGKFIEDNARITHFLAKRKAGLSATEAMHSMNKYLFDYSNLTTFERKSIRPLFLFYTWMRNNIPLQLSTSFQTPRMAALYNKIVNVEDGELPRYLRGTSAFPNPFGGGFIGSLGLPIEDLNFLNVRDTDPLFLSQLPRMAEKALSAASPIVKLPIEMGILGHTAFSKRELANIPKWKLALEMSPVSRFWRTGQKAIDPNRPMSFKLLDLLTGIRTYKVSKLQAQLDEVKRRAMGTGKFSRAGFVVYPKQKYKKEMKKVMSQISKLSRRRSKEKEHLR